ncbi:MAG: RidA family protein [Acidobacteria bacterium]|nr:RidA family protein [Acidobacteriota bacterium]
MIPSLFLLTVGLQAQENQHLNPPELAPPRGYTHVVTAMGGRLVFVAGQVATDRQGKVVGENDAARQTEKVFENVRLALKAAGAELKDVVKITGFLTDEAYIAAYRQTRERIFEKIPAPASTLLVVKRLARPELLIEVEAVAVIPGTR